MMRLWCYNHRRPTNSYFAIDVSPSDTVCDCQRTLLQFLNPALSVDLIALYKIPQTHLVPFENIESTLGALSIADLGMVLPPHKTMQQIFTDSPEEGRLHLVVVDRGTPLPVYFWVPTTQKLLSVNVTNLDTVFNFLPAIEMQDSTLKGNIVFYKTPYTSGEPQELRGTLPRDRPLHPFSDLYTAFDDVPFSRSACITVEAVRPARKHALSVQNAEECRKRQALTTGVAPSQVDVSHFFSIQSKYHERIYDYRMPFGHTGPLPESDLPPIEVLFDGFGRFLEIWRAASAANFNPDLAPHPDPLDPDDRDPLYIRIEKFVTAMSRVYGDERSTAVLATLNKIFPPKASRHSIIPAEIPQTSNTRSATGSSPRTDGIACYADIIPCILVGCKNEALTKCIPIGELVACYKLMVDHLCAARSEVVDGSRLPALGITIIGNSITFYALAYVCSTVCLPLTTSLWCLPTESGGSDRYQLYAAFKAATVLLECIDHEAKRLLDGSGVLGPISRPRLPQLKRLRRYHDSNSPTPTDDRSPDSDYIKFQIEDILTIDINRHVYKASSSILGPLVVKLTRSYSSDLHAFCAGLGRAPKLYAYERCAGGIIAVAMAYVEGNILAPSSDPVLQDKWTIAMKDLVEKMHEKGFVHGDLRPPNFMIVKDEITLLDFDWGGKVGKARYPPVPLHPVLSEGRATLSLDITKQDDERILKHTIEYVHGRGVMMEPWG